MTEEQYEELMKAMRMTYAQNQEILNFLKNALGENVPTTHNYPPVPPKSGSKPWEAWTKKEEPKDESYKI